MDGAVTSHGWNARIDTGAISMGETASGHFPIRPIRTSLTRNIKAERLRTFRKSTGESKDIQPLARAGEQDFRFNWNAPIHMSPNDKGTIYLGAQFLFRSRDHGESWERISPDLTTNDPTRQHQELSGGLTVDNSDAEKFETIYTIAESAKSGEVIWVGPTTATSKSLAMARSTGPMSPRIFQVCLRGRGCRRLKPATSMPLRLTLPLMDTRRAT